MRSVLILSLMSTVAAAAKPPTASLIVAGKGGVLEVGLDGHVIRSLSTKAASRARLLPDRRVLFLSDTGGQLWTVSLDGGQERRVAKLSQRYTLCDDAADYQKGYRFSVDDLAVQEDSDFVIDKSAKAACLSLKDRNTNMLNVDVNIHVDLASGRVRHTLAWPKCNGAAAIPRCDEADTPDPTPATSSYPYDLGDGDPDGNNRPLVRREADGKQTVVSTIGSGDFTAVALSPSTRWLARAGNESEGDYIHRDLFLLDRKTGQIWPVRDKKLRPLTARQVKQIGKAKIETADIVGETALWWLPGQDVLVVDFLLVTPGVAPVKLPGLVAR